MPNTDNTRRVQSFASLYTNAITDSPYTDTPVSKPNDLDPEDTISLTNGNNAKVKDCYYIKGRYYLKIDKNVTIDILDGLPIVKEFSVRICTSISGNTFTYGYSDLVNYRNTVFPIIYDGQQECRLIDLNLIKDTNFVENPNNGMIMPKNIIPSHEKDINNIAHFETYGSTIKNKLLTLKDKYNYGIKSPSYIMSEGIKYSFGVELEVCNGFIPKWVAYQNDLNISCVRDGSIKRGKEEDPDSRGGAEYVTGVLVGDTGFNQLQQICLTASKRTKVNYSCGIHTHLGGIDFSKQFLVNSYILALLIENEIFSCLPKSRRNNSYCRKLKPFDFQVALNNDKSNLKLEEDYNRLFKYIAASETQYPSERYNKKSQHPLGAKCGYDHSTPRYCWLNYVPAMFDTRGNGSYSIEVRNHPGSTNFKKIKNWVLLFMAIFKFVEEYPNLIKSGVTIKEILDKALPKQSDSIMKYLNSRKDLFSSNCEDCDSEEQVKKTIKQLILE